MSTIDKISEKLIANGKTQKDLTDFLGLKKSTFSGWKSGKTKSYLKYIKEIAVFLGTSIDELLSEEDDKNRPVDIEKAIGQIASMTYSKTETEKFVDSLFESFAESLSVPLINTITCGIPIFSEQNIERNILLPDMVEADFALRCKGSSMINVGINDSDIAFIRKQSTIEDGEIAVVQITDLESEAILRKVYISTSSITLIAQNSEFEPITFTGKEMNRVEIVGKCVAVLKDFNKK